MPDEPPTGAIVVVTTMPLSAEARADLSAMLGPDYVVVDVKQAPPTANIVLTTIISGQLLGSLRHLFPDARILLTELHDPARGLRYAGPVSRALESGPDGYFVAHDLEALSPIVQSEARLQLSGSRRPTTPVLGAGVGPDDDPPAPAPGPDVEPAGVVWVDRSATDGPAPPHAHHLDLTPLDDAVAGLLATATPRDSPLWVTLVAETAVHLVRERGTDVVVDVTDLPPAVRAQLRVHVDVEGVRQTP